MSPRLEPLPRGEWAPETRELVREPALNIFGTLARHPKLLKRWLVFASHVLGKSTLSPRHRELLILRTGWNCHAPYEWGQHVVIARQSGVADDEIAAIAAGPSAWERWPSAERALLRAADELHAGQTVGDDTYGELAGHFDEHQLLDIVFTVGQYHLVSMALNTFRVERDDGVTDVPMPSPA